MIPFRIFFKLALGILLTIGFGFSSSYAIELNSTNITSAPFNCNTGAISCNLNNRLITSIASGTFINHTNLQDLGLVGNDIINLESGAFDGLTNLQYLYLTNNQITSIESGAFDGLTNLLRLYLVNNAISSIENGFLEGLTNLQQLYLTNNQITSIESGAFEGLVNLQVLDLANNQIISIESGTFEDLVNLQVLDLNGIKITSIESGIFDELSNLQILSLNGGEITSIESGAFEGLTNLRFIGLSDNEITSIESGAFKGLTNLQELYLSNNCINNEDTSITNYLDSITGSVYSSQLVCVGVSYTPVSDPTTGPVTGSLTLTGPISMVNTLMLDNDLSIYDHLYVSNSIYIYDYSTLVDNNNSLLRRNRGLYEILTGIVTWISILDTIPPVVTLSGANLSLVVGSLYTDAGANWTDNIDGTGNVYTGVWGGTGGFQISGTINTNIIGTYILQYLKVDQAGNNSNIVTRTVTVTPGIVIGGGGGVGGGGVLFTPSPVITQPSAIPSTSGSIIHEIPVISSPTAEIDSAAQWAVDVGIIRPSAIAPLVFNSKITRAQLARIISIYTDTYLKKTDAFSVESCSVYDDVSDLSTTAQTSIIRVCQLGIMGIAADGLGQLKSFRPHAYVTRAQFGTILSRLLYGNKYNNFDGSKFRVDHLQALNRNNIITFTDPNLQELRSWVVTMLYRTRK